MIRPDIIPALEPLVTFFEKAKIAYYISGSVASSVYGSHRSTVDVELVADLRLSHINALYDEMKCIYYLSAQAAKEAVHHQSSFNLIHLETMLKVDVFVLKNNPFEHSAILRKREEALSEDVPRKFYISSPEDIILSKLSWYKQGSEICQQQWDDIQAVLKIQGDVLDIDYLNQWAKQLDVSKLLEQSFQDAGIQQ